VRTLQGLFRRASVTQALLQCGTDGAPADAQTAARLARDGETPGPIRHGCSGFHAASILMSAYAGWSLDDYAEPAHPSQVAVRETVARLLARDPDAMSVATDNCGVLTYEVTLVELARAYPMVGSPEMVGGTYDNLDTDLMKLRPGRLVAKAGADGIRAIGLVAADGADASGIAIKIEDGDQSRRAVKAASVEVLAQVGLLDERDLRMLAGYHHPTVFAPSGEEAASAVPCFDLVGREQDG
jgi:L-asparaginase II